MDNMDAPAAAAAAALPGTPPVEAEDPHEALLVAVESGALNTVELFDEVLRRVLDGHYCPCHVLEIVRAYWKAVLADHDPDDPMAGQTLAARLTRLGVLTLELTMKARPQWAAGGCNKWMSVLSAAAAFVSHWLPRRCPPLPRQSPDLRQWVATLMKTPEFCPDLKLRLELLHFVSMWDPKVLAEDNQLLRATAVGVFLNMLNLTVERLLPRGRAALLWPLMKVLHDMDNAGFLRVLTTLTPRNILLHQVAQTERAFAHLLLLMGQAPRRLLALRRKNALSLRATIREFNNLLLLLRVLVVDPRHQALCEVPGMCQLAAAAITAVARCIVRIPGATQSDFFFAELLTELNEFFMDLTRSWADAVKRELKQHHGHCLASVAARMRGFGWQVGFEPLPAPTIPPPEAFLDSYTKRLMEQPVRLEATDDVIDYSTLLLLLLVDYEDRDLTFTPLPDLQEAIEAWWSDGPEKKQGGDGS